jgi:hypothetical protein
MPFNLRVTAFFVLYTYSLIILLNLPDNYYKMKDRIVSSFVFFLFFGIFFSSCSIEKRHYIRGYHIEWRSSHHNSNKAVEQEEMSEEITSSSEVFEETQSIFSKDSVHGENFINSSLVTDQRIVEQTQVEPRVIIYEVEAKVKESKSGIDEIHEKVFTDAKTDPVAIFSLIFVVAGLLIALLTNAPAFIAFTLPFLGFIFGIISACRIAMHPNKNKGMALALIGTVSALIVLTIVLLMVLI